MPSPSNPVPLGMFFGDQGGPAATPPTASNGGKDCPFLDPEERAFCTLDGAMCPFVGFTYNKCKKYTNNLSKGVQNQTALTNFTPKGGPPRLEALTEAKKKESPEDEMANAFADVNRQAHDDYIDMLYGDPNKAPVSDVPKFKSKPGKKRTATGRAKLVRVAPDEKDAEAKKSQENTASRTIVTPPKKDKASIDVKDVKTSRKIKSGSLDAVERDIQAVLGMFTQRFKREKRTQLTDADVADMYDAFKSLEGSREFDNLAKLSAKRKADANFIASYLIHDGNIDRYHARKFAASVVDLINVMHGYKPIENPVERKRAEVADKEYGGLAGAAIIAAADDPRKTTIGPKDQTVTPATDAASSETPAPEAGLGTEENPPKTAEQRFINIMNKRRGVAKPPEAPAKVSRGIPRRAPRILFDPEAKEKEPEDSEDPGILGADKTFAQASSKYMNAEQFEAFLDSRIKPLSEHDKKLIFAGYAHEGKSGSAAIKALKEAARKLGEQKDYKGIANLRKVFQERAEKVGDIQYKHNMLQRQWDQNLATLKRIPIGDREALEMYNRAVNPSEEAKSKVANLTNKMFDRLYKLQVKTTRVGGHEIETLVKELTIPKFTPKDYEMIRISEQLGLVAIHKTHQYGQKYGRWNTWMLFLRSVFLPLFTAFVLKRPELIQPVMHMFPQAFFDSFFMSYINKPLPKLQSEPVRKSFMSKDDKFLVSKKMHNETSRARIMKGWDDDNVLPPDAAISHTRWYPTTKTTWSKVRHKELLKRYEKTKTPPMSKATPHSFLRR